MQSLLFSESTFRMGSPHYLCPQCSMVVISKLLNSGVPPGSGSFIPGAILVEKRIYTVPCLTHVYFDFCHGGGIQQAMFMKLITLKLSGG